ncbi:MAG: hypothetical protein ACR2LI_07280 [Propionibacteriaceae bacterium]
MPASIRRKVLAAGAALAVPFALAATAVPAHAETGPVTVSLDSLKGSDASGTATLTPTSDGGLKIHIKDTGMTPGMPHAQHLHGDVSGKHYFCPPASADKNGDGFISIEEGVKMYGGIFISLTTKGDTSAKSGLALDRFPVADKNGDLDYTRTIPAAQIPDGTIANLDKLHIVQHGIDANGNGKYDLDGLGESTFARSLGVKGVPEEGTDGATCGMVSASGVNTGGTTTAGLDHSGLIGLGSVAVLGAGGVLLLRRRLQSQTAAK